MIPISKPSIEKKDLRFIKNVFESKILTDGYFQQKSENLIKKLIKSKFVAITQSCTAALEISAILINLKKNDEVIMPSYGFVSVPNAVLLKGAKPVFADIDPKTLSISYEEVKKRITKKTKAIYVIHYGGNPCEIEKISNLAKKKKIFLIEDAAHSFMAKYKKKNLGTIGDIGVYSFHETKNIVAGQGGCITINNPKLNKRANYILDKGTNRKQFINNLKNRVIQSNKKNYYSWVDIGSEYRASEITCALLYSQLLKINKIQNNRMILWNKYKNFIYNLNSDKFYLVEPILNSQSSYHILAIVFNDLKISNEFQKFMKKNKIAATFHYIPLHKSKMGKRFCNYKLPVTESIYLKVIRLPLFPDMKRKEMKTILKKFKIFFNI